MSALGLELLGVGAQSPLGATAEATAAAVRAGLSAFSTYSLPQRFNRRIDARVSRIPWSASSETAERVAAFGEAAMIQALAALDPSEPRRLRVLWALPEERPGASGAEMDRALAEALLGSSDRRLREAVDRGDLRLFRAGHAAGVAAIAAARDTIAADPRELALVCGADSWVGHEGLSWLRDQGRMIAKTRRTGFVAGEGAAALLFGSGWAARELSIDPLASLEGIGLSHEPKHQLTDEICLGEGLTRAFWAALGEAESFGGAKIDALLADANGERFRAEELTYAMLRTSERMRDPGGFRSTASAIGDVGAAWVPMAVALATEAWRRGYAEGPRVMISASSDAGARGAVVLREPRRVPARPDSGLPLWVSTQIRAPGQGSQAQVTNRRGA